MGVVTMAVVATSTLVATTPALAVWAARQRLEREGEVSQQRVAILAKPLEACRRKDVEAFREAVLRDVASESTRAATARCAALESELAAQEAFAERVRSWSCGRLATKLGGTTTCERATSALEAARALRADVRLAQDFGAQHEAVLDAMDVAASLEAALPQKAAPWRASWQREDRDRDVAALADVARRRFSTGPERQLRPLQLFVDDLSALSVSASAALSALKQDPPLAKRVAFLRREADRSVAMLRESRELLEERRQFEALECAKRTAEAAQIAASEQRRARIAIEANNAERRRCLRVLEKLQTALEEWQAQRSDDAQRPWRPASLSECRNDEDPVSLDALSSFAPADLCLLPSGNCIAVAHLLAMRRDVDPFTELPLPASVRKDVVADQQRRARTDHAVSDLLAAAHTACTASSSAESAFDAAR